MTEDEISGFVASSIPSVWALELLLLLKRKLPSGASAEELVRDLRSSTMAVSQALDRLQSAGLIAEEENIYFYRPATAELDHFVASTERLYRVKPAMIIKAVVTARNEALKIFADSFKLKE